MEWQLNTAWILKIFIVPVGLWIANAVGFRAAAKLSKGDDIALPYHVLWTVPLAWIMTGAFACWLIGGHAFVIGLIVSLAGVYSSTRWRSYQRRKNKVS